MGFLFLVTLYVVQYADKMFEQPIRNHMKKNSRFRRAAVTPTQAPHTNKRDDNKIIEQHQRLESNSKFRDPHASREALLDSSNT